MAFVATSTFFTEFSNKPEYFRYKSPPVLENMGGDVQGSQQELGLDVLVNIVESSHVRSAVTDHEVSLATCEVLHDLVGGGELGYVPLQLHHAREGCHRLEIHGNYLDIFPLSLGPLDL